MKPAISYSRLSTLEQAKGHGKTRQAEWVQSLCKQNGLQLIDDLEDWISAYHGLNATKGAFAGFLEAIKDGRIERGTVLICESMDRISRQAPMKSIPLIASILEAGIDICTKYATYTEENANDPNMIFQLIADLSRSHDESKWKSIRVGKAWGAKKRNAAKKVLTKKVPAWLEVINGKIEPIKSRCDTIKEIFRLTQEGMGLSAIVKHLTQKNTPPFGGRYWGKSYIAKILKNPAVMGEYQPKKGHNQKIKDGEPIKGYYSKVIKEAQFYAVQSIIAKRVKVRGRVGNNLNLFSGLMLDDDGSSFTLVNKGIKNIISLVNAHASRGENNSKYRQFIYSIFEKAFIQSIYSVNPSELLPKIEKNKSMEIDGLKAKIKDLTERIMEIRNRIKTDKKYASLFDIVIELEAEKEETYQQIEKIKTNAEPLEQKFEETKALIEAIEDNPELKIKLKTYLRNFINRIDCKLFDYEDSEGILWRVMKSAIIFTHGLPKLLIVAYKLYGTKEVYRLFWSPPLVKEDFEWEWSKMVELPIDSAFIIKRK